MKKNLIKIILTGLFFAAAVLPAFSADAKVTYVKGKVEVSRNGEWVALKVGDTVVQSETINTGFQSEARLNLNGSVMAVPALTRVTLETLSTTSAKDTVSLYVDTGAVRSKVTHTDNKKIDYTARTAVAVASVRGTDFTITAKGKVRCTEGAVAVYSAKKYKAPAETSSEEAVEEEEETTEENAEAENSSDEQQGPADSNTPADEISSNSPAGSVVVGAGQSTSFTDSGNPEKPANDTSKKADDIKNQVNTQSEKDSASETDTTTVEPKATKGKIIASVELE